MMSACSHEGYASPISGGWGGYRGACHGCGWTGLRHLDKDAARADAQAHEHSTTAAPLPELVGLCPVHASEFYAPVDPADPDPKCPACDCRLLVYAPRVDQRDVMAARDRRNAEAQR